MVTVRDTSLPAPPRSVPWRRERRHPGQELHSPIHTFAAEPIQSDHSEAMATHLNPFASPAPEAAAAGCDPERWDQRYREGRDGWELGQPAPPLERFLRHHSLAPSKAGRVLVPGCGRGHEADLLAELGFSVVGLDFSTEALKEARRLHGPERPELRWIQADLFAPAALKAAGLTDASLDGMVEHTCFCAIDPVLREVYRSTVRALLKPGGWLLGLFLCHSPRGGPPFGSDPTELAEAWRQAGMVEELWQPAEGSLSQRGDEWLGLWRKPLMTDSER